MDVSLLHTAQLTADQLAAIRAMLDAAYDGEFADEDWDHALGGLHAIVWEGDAPVAHGSAVRRQFLYAAPDVAWRNAEPFRVGYIEAVAVRADRRRQGLGRAVMAALTDVCLKGFAFGALSASDEGMPLYQALGWQPLRGATFVLSASGAKRTAEEDGGIYVTPGAPIDLDGRLACDWRGGDVW